MYDFVHPPQKVPKIKYSVLKRLRYGKNYMRISPEELIGKKSEFAHHTRRNSLQSRKMKFLSVHKHSSTPSYQDDKKLCPYCKNTIPGKENKRQLGSGKSKLEILDSNHDDRDGIRNVAESLQNERNSANQNDDDDKRNLISLCDKVIELANLQMDVLKFQRKLTKPSKMVNLTGCTNISISNGDAGMEEVREQLNSIEKHLMEQYKTLEEHHETLQEKIEGVQKGVSLLNPVDLRKETPTSFHLLREPLSSSKPKVTRAKPPTEPVLSPTTYEVTTTPRVNDRTKIKTHKRSKSSPTFTNLGITAPNKPFQTMGSVKGTSCKADALSPGSGSAVIRRKSTSGTPTSSSLGGNVSVAPFSPPFKYGNEIYDDVNENDVNICLPGKEFLTMINKTKETNAFVTQIWNHIKPKDPYSEGYVSLYAEV